MEKSTIAKNRFNESGDVEKKMPQNPNPATATIL